MNTREQRLMIGLLVLLLGGIAFLGFDQLAIWKKRLESRSRELAVVKAESEELLAQEKLWETRSEWLKTAQPPFQNRKDAELALIRLIEESADKHQVTILKNQPNEPVDMVDMVASTMLVEIRADLEKALRWLHDLQQPATFLSIPSLRILPDQEDTAKVMISINLQKWFRKAESS
jgi:hypothetical protein